jgi:thioredoxin reductase
VAESERIRADVAVVGAGPAGIAAAVHAAEAGRSVVVIEGLSRPGGQIWRHRARRDLPRRAWRWLHRLDHSGARLLAGTAVVDAVAGEDGVWLTGERGDETILVQAGAAILATGARELFLPFPGWTLPGVIGVGGAQALLKAGARFQGLRTVVAGTGPLLLPVAAALARAGARVEHLIEQAPRARVTRFAGSLWRTPGKLAQAAGYRLATLRAPYARGTWVVRAEGTDAVREVVLTDGRRERTERCDLLCVAYGLVPAVELPRLLGCELHDGFVAVDALQRTSVPNVYCAGEPTGIGGVDAAILEGSACGPAQRAEGLRAPAGGDLRAATRVAHARPGRHHRLPVRGRRARAVARLRYAARRQARHARGHGPVPGPGLRRRPARAAGLGGRQRPAPRLPRGGGDLRGGRGARG